MAEDISSVVLAGSRPTNRHPRIGAADPNRQLEVTLKLRRRTEEGLPTLKEFMEGRRAQAITREDLLTRYAASEDDAKAVTAWAASKGLHVVQVDLAARSVRVGGTLGNLAGAFETPISTYRHALTGAAFYCPDDDVRIPKNLEGIVTGVFGLNDMPVLQRFRPVRMGVAAMTDPKQHYPGSFYPHEVSKLYRFPATQGAGQRVAVLEFGGGFDPLVLADYFTRDIGLPVPPTVNSISVLGQPNNPEDRAVTGEVYLDIEVIGAMAPKAVVDVFFAPWTGRGFLESIEQAIRNADYAAISISYGLDEDARGTAADPGWPQLRSHIDEAFREAVAIGIPVFVSSGDQGSGCQRGVISVGGQEVEVTQFAPETHAAYPASSPYATAVGGTQLYAKDGGIQKEVVWNELGPLQQNEFYFGGATGGAVSHRYGAQPPSYQTKAGLMPKSANDGAAGRGIPDVAGNAGASTGYLVSQPPHSRVKIAPVGGTSAAAPMWAALMACVREQLLADLGKVPPFFFNDFVYERGKSDAFNDIVGGRPFIVNAKGHLVPGPFTDQGTNRSSEAEGYFAVAGYDLCTGWGSPNGTALVTQLKDWLAKLPKP